jgi:protein-L-isoaspartate(D-aspartate) O-methyltransferase
MKWFNLFGKQERDQACLPEFDYFGPFADQRRTMIEKHLYGRGVRDRGVLEAMLRVPRELFIDEKYHHSAYADHPQPIGMKQTISQPYVVARMTELARIEPGCRVLEIGSGCGYQTAIIMELGGEIVGIEYHRDLVKTATERLDRLGYKQFILVEGNGYHGFQDGAPFDVILSGAAPELLPECLPDQLNDGGRMVIPIGPGNSQYLYRYTRLGGTCRREKLFGVRFVPLIPPDPV